MTFPQSSISQEMSHINRLLRKKCVYITGPPPLRNR